MLLTSCNYSAEPLINRTQADELRIHTFNNCKDLLNQKTTIKGTVVYEQCNKNCLGGCPNSGPLYYYYGIKDENDCLFFDFGRTTGFMKQPSAVELDLRFGQKISKKTTPHIYASAYCGGYNNPRNHAECVYFLI